MSCDGVKRFNPLCQVHEAANQAASDAFTHIATWFGKAAAEATTWLWQEIGSATSINLDSPHLLTDLAATGAIAVVLCLGLFLLQVITGVLRRDPGALGRAAKGLVIALVASGLALTVTRILLGAVDRLSAGFVQYTMHTNIEGLGSQLALASAISAYTHNPATLLLFSLVILAAVVVVWAAMMIRKMMVITAAVLTPLAFSGATADITRSWVRKWIEFMVAMIVSKLLLVIILMVGVSVFEGAGQTTHPGPGQLLTQLATGALILFMGGFAPWVAIKMFHFAGESLHSAHMYAAQAPAGARSLVAAPQKLNRLHTEASATVAKFTHHGPASNGWQTAPPPQQSHAGDDEQIHQKAEHLRDQAPPGGPTGGGGQGPGAGGGGAAHAQATPTRGSSPGPASAAGAGSSGAAGGAGAASGSAAAAPVVGAAVAGAGIAYSVARNAVTAPGRAAQQAAAASDAGSTRAEAPAESQGQPPTRPPTKPT